MSMSCQERKCIRAKAIKMFIRKLLEFLVTFVMLAVVALLTVKLNPYNKATHYNQESSSETALENDQTENLQNRAIAKLDKKPYLSTIASVAKDNAVILAIVESGLLDMAINLFVSSIKPLGISNFLILATDDATCPQLATYGITCVMYKNLNFSREANTNGSKDFNARMSIRYEIMTEILSEGFTVLHTDTDLYFYSNPFDHIHCPPETCHMAALYDYVMFNAGFVLLHPNDYSIYLYKGMMELQEDDPSLTEQKKFNIMILRLRSRRSHFEILKLPEEKFQCGQFFDRHFFIDTARPCPECVVVHNNWIIGMHEKILRAKEMHQWMYDKNGYYSSTTSKYLTYESPAVVDSPITEQMNTLGRALNIAYLLNRTVILPKFHVKGKQRPLLHIASISALDKVFGEAYREHSFLFHPLVPEAVKQSIRGPVNIVDNLQRGIEESWILQQFKGETASVLHFGTLDRDVIFTNPSLAKVMRRNIEAGLQITKKMKETVTLELMVAKMKRSHKTL